MGRLRLLFLNVTKLKVWFKRGLLEEMEKFHIFHVILIILLLFDPSWSLDLQGSY